MPKYEECDSMGLIGVLSLPSLAKNGLEHIMRKILTAV